MNTYKKLISVFLSVVLLISTANSFHIVADVEQPDQGETINEIVEQDDPQENEDGESEVDEEDDKDEESVDDEETENKEEDKKEEDEINEEDKKEETEELKEEEKEEPAEEEMVQEQLDQSDTEPEEETEEVFEIEDYSGYKEFDIDAENFFVYRKNRLRNTKSETIPTSYSLIDLDQVTSVKDQGNFGTCWAHSVLASMESNYLKKYGASLDLSEFQLAYFSYNNKNIADPLDLITNDAFEVNGNDHLLDEGGNAVVTTYLVANGIGLIDEADMPYPTVYNFDTSTINNNNCYGNNKYYLADTKWLAANDSASIKEVLMNGGALTMSYFAITKDHKVILNDGSEVKYTDVYNEETSAYYNNTIIGSNHAVTIVGWDDNYNRNNFVRKPDNNGAWLVKNSWGTVFGDEGYFWLSYEDKAFADVDGTVCSFSIEPTYDNIFIYQYDGTVPLYDKAYDDHFDIANIYTAQENEILKKVGYFVDNAGTSVEISVYTGASQDQPLSGNRQFNTTVTEKYAGYHTVDVGNITIGKGTAFSVVIRQTKSSDRSVITTSFAKTDSISWLKATDSTALHQSFESIDGGTSWTDLGSSQMSATIKAITSRNSDLYYISYYNTFGTAHENPSSFTNDSSDIVLKNPVRRPGYSFEGWYTDNGYNNRISEIDVSEYHDNIALYAKWQIIDYTITYDMPDGAVQKNPTAFTINTKFKLQPAEKEHYEFLYWYGLTEDNKEVELDHVGPGWYGDFTLYSKWKPVEYEISYNLNGGSATNVETYNIETETFTLNNPYKYGYVFEGWTGTGLNGTVKTVTIPKGSFGNRSYTAVYRDPKASFSGTDITLNDRIYINGQPQSVNDLNNVHISADSNVATVYTISNSGVSDRHKQYPTGMKVYFLQEDGTGDRIAVHHEKFDNILTYAGASIRITGKKGIRIITAIPTAVKNKLVNSEIDGYKVMEFGTLMGWASKLGDKEPTLDMINQKIVAKGYSYSRENNYYVIYNETGGMTRYTNVLVGNYTDEQCASDVAMRSYMIIRPKNGTDSSKDIVLYGGTIYRSISYVALQNKNAFKTGTAGYEYIWKLIKAGYPDVYDAEYGKS